MKIKRELSRDSEVVQAKLAVKLGASSCKAEKRGDGSSAGPAVVGGGFRRAGMAGGQATPCVKLTAGPVGSEVAGGSPGAAAATPDC